jgi:hypothetical protein
VKTLVDSIEIATSGLITFIDSALNFLEEVIRAEHGDALDDEFLKIRRNVEGLNESLDDLLVDLLKFARESRHGAS